MLVLGIAFALVAAGCSREIEAYSGVNQIAGALQDEELGCETLTTPDLTNENSLVDEGGTCEVEGESAQLFTFASEEDAERWLSLGNMLAVPVVRGEGWVVVLETEATAERVADGIGGEIVE